MPKKITNKLIAPVRAICFGNTKASVVVLKNRRGSVKKNKPMTNRLMFSKYPISSFVFCFML